MAEDDGASSADEPGGRIKAKKSLVSNYRTRPIAAGLIEQAGYGQVDFAIPGLGEHMRKRR